MFSFGRKKRLKYRFAVFSSMMTKVVGNMANMAWFRLEQVLFS
jgi:hypothetical protein